MLGTTAFLVAGVCGRQMSTTIDRTTEIVLTILGILILTWVGLMAVMMIAMALMGGVSGTMMPMMDHGIHSGGSHSGHHAGMAGWIPLGVLPLVGLVTLAGAGYFTYQIVGE